MSLSILHICLWFVLHCGGLPSPLMTLPPLIMCDVATSLTLSCVCIHIHEKTVTHTAYRFFSSHDKQLVCLSRLRSNPGYFWTREICNCFWVDLNVYAWCLVDNDPKWSWGAIVYDAEGQAFLWTQKNHCNFRCWMYNGGNPSNCFHCF